MMRVRTAQHVRALLPTALTRSLPALLSFVGLTAVIVGILAMHVWMGGPGSTAHHSAASTTMSSTDAHPAFTATTADDTASSNATTSPDQAHTGLIAQILPVMTSMVADPSDPGASMGCGESCADEMALSMCVLAIVLVGIAWLLTPTGRALLSSLIRRGPPLTHWASRPAPTPSLTHLCISRT